MRREILLVDDERSVRHAFKVVLEEAGYIVREAISGVDAVRAVSESTPDLVLLDVMMPGLDGRMVCGQIRKIRPSLPIVFLTALDHTEHELAGFEAGADDYISKSVPKEVLLARILSVLRRVNNNQHSVFNFGKWTICASDFSMCDIRGVRVSLTDREVAFLRELSARPNELFSRDYLSRQFIDEGSKRFDDALGVFVGRLRTKLEDSSKCIKTIHGAGYSYCPREA